MSIACPRCSTTRQANSRCRRPIVFEGAFSWVDGRAPPLTLACCTSMAGYFEMSAFASAWSAGDLETYVFTKYAFTMLTDTMQPMQAIARIHDARTSNHVTRRSRHSSLCAILASQGASMTTMDLLTISERGR